MTKKHLAAVCLTASMALAGCDEPLTVDEFISSMIDIQCALQVECLGAGATECREDWQRKLSIPKASTDKGSVTFLARQAQKCLDVLAKTTCEDNFGGGDACDYDAIFVGKLQVGAECLSSTECAGESHCYWDKEDADACSGVCRARVPAGGTCSFSLPCVSSAWCNEGVCQASLKKGERCVPSVGCGAGLYCNADKVCDWQLRAGEPCSSDHACRAGDGLYCHPVERVCRAIGRAGDKCSSHDLCSLKTRCVIAPGASEGTCELPPKVGEDCIPGLISYCAGVWWCSTETKKCTEHPGLGEACGYYSGGDYVGCREGGYCHDGSCTAYRKEGESCRGNGWCGVKLKCIEGTCQVPENPCEGVLRP